MQRRDFLINTGILSSTIVMSACGSNNSDVVAVDQPIPDGAVTLYYEFKIAGPEIQAMMQNVGEEATALEEKTGFLGLSMKMMIGDSTMVNNMMPDLKGVLKSAYIDAAQVGRRPFLYALLIRFDNYDNLMASGAKEWFSNTIEPQLFAYQPGTPPTKTPIILDYYQGIYKTVAAGDSDGIYTTQEQILAFLQNQKDVVNATYQVIPADGTSSGASVSVQNHVVISNDDTDAINTKATALLTVAQETYQPSTNDTNGDSGTLSDSNYRKAITTEILQNAFAYGDTRNYLFHGVWESIADHENSHLDPRFMQAAGPVGAYVIAGPSEPFYQTVMLKNNNG
ncbi:MAG: hypothetical protein HKP62_09055 [Sulfurovum sp.]|nr:hypothetical protein [Sulfurovum sp.]NNJ46146.1 hypothetical protein [Sulfurovum sp.]